MDNNQLNSKSDPDRIERKNDRGRVREQKGKHKEKVTKKRTPKRREKMGRVRRGREVKKGKRVKWKDESNFFLTGQL